jgi:uncharacterized protein involved in outer membrane biogenesis
VTKIIKYILGIISVTIILLLVIPFFISLDTYKEIITLQVKKHIGRDLKIDGQISFDILPMPQIKLTQLKLSSLPQAKNLHFLEIEAISGKLALLPILKGQIVITSLELIKPVISLERLKNGKSTWEFQNPAAADHPIAVSVTQDKSMKSKASIANLPFIINDISIQRGILNYIDKDKNISIEDLDLNIKIKDIYSPINSSITNLDSSQKMGSHWSHEKIDLSSLTTANATIDLKAKKLKNSDFTLDNIVIKSELNDRILKIKSFTGGLYGGNLEGSCSISGKANQPISLKLTLKNAQIHNIVPEARKIKVTNGIMDFACDIKSEGYSQFDYVKQLHGTINLSGRDGRVSGIDLHKLIHALDKPRDINAIAQGLEEGIGKGATAFQSLKSNISIDKGIMNITNCEIISNETSAILEGKINLLGFTLNVFSTINSGIKYLPPITIYFYGSIDDPQHKIDVKAIWQYLANNALTGVIDNLKQGKIKPQDLLKGIIEGPRNKSDTESSEAEDRETLHDATNKLLEKGIKGLFE